MRHFPIYSQGVFLGVAIVYQQSGVWYMMFKRDDRPGVVYSLLELAEGLKRNDDEFLMMMAQVGYVANDIEDYTGCPFASLPQPAPAKSDLIVHAEERNPFLTMLQLKNGPWIASFMLRYVKEERLVFSDVPQGNRQIFTMSHTAHVKLISNCAILYSTITGERTVLTNVQATFCHMHDTNLSHQGIHNGYVYGAGEDLRVCQ